MGGTNTVKVIGTIINQSGIYTSSVINTIIVYCPITYW